jgi:multisubunit Na+/H+ antiporter MnhE subunit
MLNIFNLFLFLLALWLMFMAASQHFTWLYLFLGLIASGLVALMSKRLRLVEKNSELLYLSFGFYRHFILIFIGNFFSSLSLIIKMALGKSAPNPTLHKVKLKANHGFNPALLIASFNMSTGNFCVDSRENEILVHALNSGYFKKFDLQKICINLRNINDDNII